ncbi:uracil-DNA glycosylase [Aquamicrobium zhengzhouense]|uniref:Type-5 uracil-DNA glycosylase n=1 Tax=Aquamicrobium zhengzhouense TaxID=2781738 RepID=A0ABS0SAA7_9HYPH|nr:uracil-DNA glycosylase [Aquamicrobium zhengzhouense]MBI1620218.1 uracil-DNA glycosylase [Aquamicrobium zhengzhouense]
MIPKRLSEPPHDCPLCPRLHHFIAEWREREPEWFNGPVPTFFSRDGDESVRLLIVGLAPGLRGANRTGRPFTGDYAGELLYATLKRFGFSTGEFQARPDDGVELIGAALTNAVRCVPPENKPVGAEVNTCRSFLKLTIERFRNLQAIVTLGTIAHQSTIRALGQRVSDFPFSHGGQGKIGNVSVFSSYHCSRYNTNTGRLTEEMFVDVFKSVANYLGERSN